MTQFAVALRAQNNVNVGAGNTQSVSLNSASEFLSKTVSSLDLSGAESRIFELKLRIIVIELKI